MISFRYHLVSIIAVFLALALGIVVGTTGLNGAILSDLRKNVRSLKNDNSSLRESNSTLQKQAANADQFAGAYTKQLLASTLTDKNVAVISGPGADSKIKSAVETNLGLAGAKVVSRIQLSSDYIDPQRSSDITSLVSGQAHPAGLQLPATSDTSILAGAMLAYVLSGKGTASDIPLVLSAFTQLNMLKVEGSGDPKAAQLAVVISDATYAKGDAKAKGMPALISQMNQDGMKTVVAGDSDAATGAGAIAQVRNDSTLNRSISTVDNADTALGQLSTVLALVGLVGGSAGQYGTGAGVDSLFPKPSG